MYSINFFGAWSILVVVAHISLVVQHTLFGWPQQMGYYCYPKTRTRLGLVSPTCIGDICLERMLVNIPRHCVQLNFRIHAVTIGQPFFHELKVRIQTRLTSERCAFAK